MKIAAVQMVSGPDLGANLLAARRLLESAAAQGARLAALPEYFCLMGQQDSDKLAIAETLGHGGPIQAVLSSAARELKLWIIGGTLPIKADTPDRVRNSTLVFSPAGDVVARYDKIHMFDVDLDKGESWRESRTYNPGAAARVAELPFGKLGFAVCYDVRFPQLFRSEALAGADILTVPAAFTKQTGEAHWEVLLRARAIENGAFLIAAAQAGLHEDGRETFGHSMVVDPWGRILASAGGTGEGVVLAEIDTAEVAAARAKIPNLKNARDFEVETVRFGS